MRSERRNPGNRAQIGECVDAQKGKVGIDIPFNHLHRVAAFFGVESGEDCSEARFTVVLEVIASFQDVTPRRENTKGRGSGCLVPLRHAESTPPNRLLRRRRVETPGPNLFAQRSHRSFARRTKRCGLRLEVLLRCTDARQAAFEAKRFFTEPFIESRTLILQGLLKLVDPRE